MRIEDGAEKQPHTTAVLCPKCGAGHGVDLGKPYASMLCPDCQRFSEIERRGRRAWLWAKQSKRSKR